MSTELDIKSGYVRDITEQFASSFALLQSICHQIAREHGFWEDLQGADPRFVMSEKLLLAFTEICEGYEDYRAGKKQSDKIPGFSPMEEEIADSFIRLMDYAEYAELNVAEAIVAKLQYNNSRPYKHGKKF